MEKIGKAEKLGNKKTEKTECIVRRKTIEKPSASSDRQTKYCNV